MTLLLSLPGGTEWILIFIVLFLLLIPPIFYLITLQSTLSAIAPENRTMPPSNVWLLLIPFFGIIWHFIVVKNMADSIKAEADSKNIFLAEAKPAYSIGMAMCILSCVNVIPLINFLTGPAMLICWIVYWVKIASYKKTLLTVNFDFIGVK